MFFKKRKIGFFVFGALILSLLLLLGCGLNVGESSKPASVIQAQSSGCLDQSFEDLKLMYQGLLPDEKVAPAIQCLSSTIQEFTNNVEGQNKLHFTPEELTSFLNKKVFTSGTQITPALAQEMMKLKMVFLGGNQNEFTKKQLLQFTRQLESLIPDIISLNRYIHMTKKPELQTHPSDFNQVERDFNLAADHVAQFVQQGYDLKDLKSLLDQIITSNVVDFTDILEDYHKYYNLLVSAHTLITSNEKTQLNTTDVKNLLFLASRGYFHYLHYKKYLSPIKYQNEMFAQQALELLPKVHATLEKTFTMNPQGFMTSKHIIETYKTVCHEFKITPPLSENSLEVVLHTLWNNILNPPEQRLKGQTLNGFDLQAWNLLYGHLHSLLAADVEAYNILINNPYPHQAQLKDLIQNQILQTTDPYKLKILQEMKAVNSGPVPLTMKDNFMKIFDKDSSIYNYHDLQLSNLARFAARLITMSYASSMEQINNLDLLTSHISLAEMEVGFFQIKDVLVELDYLTANSNDFMKSRFRDANVFISRSNGDDWMSFFETHDLALHLISGVNRAAKIRPYIQQECLPLMITPARSDTLIDESCLLNLYYKYDLGFEFLPQHLLLKSTESLKKNKEYYLNLLVAGGYVENKKKLVLMEDADRFPHVVQYIEMLFSLYDTNRDGIVVKDEALRAFPMYKEIIKKALASISGGDSVTEDEYPGVFIYFLKYGRAPDGIIEKIQFKLFISNEKKWVINSNRHDLGMVFRSLASY